MITVPVLVWPIVDATTILVGQAYPLKRHEKRTASPRRA